MFCTSSWPLAVVAVTMVMPGLVREGPAQSRAATPADAADQKLAFYKQLLTDWAG